MDVGNPWREYVTCRSMLRKTIVNQRCDKTWGNWPYSQKFALFATAVWKVGTYGNRRSLPEVYAAVRAGYHESGAWPLDTSLYPACSVDSSNRAPGSGPFDGNGLFDSWVWVRNDAGNSLHRSLKGRIMRIVKGSRFSRLTSCSFDKGFYRPAVRDELDELLETVILPKKGGLSNADRERQSSEAFVAGRKQHSAVESGINALENHGLGRCADHGLDGFQRYVALDVVARNLQILGHVLQQQALTQRQAQKKARTTRARKRLNASQSPLKKHTMLCLTGELRPEHPCNAHFFVNSLTLDAMFT